MFFSLNVRNSNLLLEMMAVLELDPADLAREVGMGVPVSAH
jgi:hypothetical protein